MKKSKARREAEESAQTWVMRRQAARIAAGLPANNPRMSLSNLRRVTTNNPREHGRNRIERALRDIHGELKNIIPILGAPDDAESRFDFLREWVDGIDDSVIADDAKAGRLLLNVAYAIAHAFELGRDAGSGPPERKLHGRYLKRRGSGLTTGAENKADAEERHQAMKEVWRTNRSEISGRKLAKKICDGEFGRITDLSEERVRVLISKWKRAGLPASS
jgi:hypothetical protein